MTTHQFTTEDDTIACITCGALYQDDDRPRLQCTGRTDMVHGYDTSSHSLDDCARYDTFGCCDHLAILAGCDCLMCQGF